MSALLSALLITSAGSHLAVRVEGEGWMRFSREGRIVYARRARLQVQQGRLAGAPGVFVVPSIPVSAQVQLSGVDAEGWVSGVTPTGTIRLGRLALARFETGPNQEVNGFWLSQERPTVGHAGAEGFGVFSTSATGAGATTRPVQNPAPTVPSPTAVLAGGQSREATSRTTGATGAPAAANPRSLPTIRFRGDLMVENTPFRLGDVAEIEAPESVKAQLAQVVLGDLPPLGMTRTIDRERVLLRLRVAGFASDSVQIEMPAAIQVRRPSQEISHDQLVQVAIRAAQEKFGAGVQFSDLNPQPPLVVNPGQVELKVRPLSNSSGQRVTATVDVLLEGRVDRSRTLTLQMASTIPLPAVGAAVTVRARSAGVRVEFSGRVTAVRGLHQVEVQATDGRRFVGTVVAVGVVEIPL